MKREPTTTVEKCLARKRSEKSIESILVYAIIFVVVNYPSFDSLDPPGARSRLPPATTTWDILKRKEYWRMERANLKRKESKIAFNVGRAVFGQAGLLVQLGRL